MSILEEGEVGEGGCHAGGVGIVGIHDKAVGADLPQFAAAVGGFVGCQGMVNLLGRDAKVEADGDCGTQIGDVVSANEVGTNGAPRPPSPL